MNSYVERIACDAYRWCICAQAKRPQHSCNRSSGRWFAHQSNSIQKPHYSPPLTHSLANTHTHTHTHTLTVLNQYAHHAGVRDVHDLDLDLLKITHVYNDSRLPSVRIRSSVMSWGLASESEVSVLSYLFGYFLLILMDPVLKFA